MICCIDSVVHDVCTKHLYTHQLCHVCMPILADSFHSWASVWHCIIEGTWKYIECVNIFYIVRRKLVQATHTIEG